MGRDCQSWQWVDLAEDVSERTLGAMGAVLDHLHLLDNLAVLVGQLMSIPELPELELPCPVIASLLLPRLSDKRIAQLALKLF
jgi:hypothetical protein